MPVDRFACSTSSFAIAGAAGPRRLRTGSGDARAGALRLIEPDQSADAAWPVLSLLGVASRVTQFRAE